MPEIDEKIEELEKRVDEIEKRIKPKSASVRGDPVVEFFDD